ncbi:unnamed protein product, partial [Symbiodinium pilosum]
ARDSFSFVSAVLSRGRVLRRLVEKAVLEIVPADIRMSNVDVCRAYLSPEGLDRARKVLRGSVVKAIKSLAEQLDQTYKWLAWTRSIARPHGAILAEESEEMITDAWRGIVTEVANILRTFELPMVDPSRELLLLYSKLLGRVLPELCPVPNGCISAILQKVPSTSTVSLVSWDKMTLPDKSEVLVVLENPEALLPKTGVHSGWEIDLRQPLPDALTSESREFLKLPGRAFACKLPQGKPTWEVIRPFEKAAEGLPDKAFCFCAARIGAD